MLNKKFISSGFLAIIIFLNLLIQSQICRASVSTQTEIKDQMKNAAQAGWGMAEPTGVNSLPGIIQVAISAFLGLLGIIFLVLIIYSGFNWMTAQGDEEKVTLAKNTLTRAVIGLIIIVAAYSITYFVFSNLPGGGTGNSAVGGS